MYEVIGEPPSEAGAMKPTVARPFAATADAFVGESGTEAVASADAPAEPAEQDRSSDSRHSSQAGQLSPHTPRPQHRLPPRQKASSPARYATARTRQSCY